MRRKILFIVSATVLIIVIGIVLVVSQKGDINTAITAQQAVDLIQKNQNNPGFVILDVRTPQEYQSGIIAGAINIDFYAVDFKNQISQLDKNKKYLVYCRTANRSGQTATIMKSLKFKEVYDLAGGVVAWSQKGFLLVKP
jgi:rhodanese-related sulfurtransferase